jgi:putative ABC transport system permease protein
MKVADLVKLSLFNLFRHKMRSFLTSLGIIFGVGSVISMLAISEGAQRKALDQIESMGIDNIIVYVKEPKTMGNGSSDSASQSSVKQFGLTENDLVHLKDMQNVKHIDVVKNTRHKVFKGDKEIDLKVLAVNSTFKDTVKAQMRKGRWISRIDDENGVSVCVIGSQVARQLFDFQDSTVIGKRIKISTAVFRIIGVFDTFSMGSIPELGRLDDAIFVPKTVADKVYGKSSVESIGGAIKLSLVPYDSFVVKVKELPSIEHTAKRIRNYLEKSHKDVRDWALIVPLELFKQKKKTQGIFTIIMASIASISLIVGGVGIMNIMLANIFERRKEIGTRRALGAKQKDILNQFLFETIFLTVLGGILGIVLGVIISESITYYAKWPTIYTVTSVVVSLVVSSLVGVVFGTYPAIKAAKQNPIDVLRAD